MRSESTRFLGQPRLTKENVPFTAAWLVMASWFFKRQELPGGRSIRLASSCVMSTPPERPDRSPEDARIPLVAFLDELAAGFHHSLRVIQTRLFMRWASRP